MDENVNTNATAFASEGAHAVSAANEIAHVAAATARAADTAQSAAPARGRDEAFRLLNVIAQTHAGVSVIGSMNADYTVVAQRLPKPGETINGGPLRLLPGGKSANQAAAAAESVPMRGCSGLSGKMITPIFCSDALRMRAWIRRMSMRLPGLAARR